LAVVHETTLPYSAYQNGKQEVFWAQLEGRLVEMVRGLAALRLRWLNRASQAWVEQDYHCRTHRGIDAPPLDRLLAGPDVSRPAPEMAVLRWAFTRRVRRSARRSDATVVVAGVRFELPSRFRHLSKLTLRYPSWDLRQLLLVDPDSGQPLAELLPQDKERNASAQRRALEPVAAPLAPQSLGNQALPALLTQWLTDYAATGLPPAYLPKDEIQEEFCDDR